MKEGGGCAYVFECEKKYMRVITGKAGPDDENVGFTTRGVEDCWIWTINLEGHFVDVR